jgi:hypothetical protein
MSEDPPVDRCPFCERDSKDVRGRYDGRVLVNGRGVYHCPEDPEHRWQNADEEPSSKGFPIR